MPCGKASPPGAVHLRGGPDYSRFRAARASASRGGARAADDVRDALYGIWWQAEPRVALHLAPLVLAAGTAGQAAPATAAVSAREVSIREEPLSIPTWMIGPPELHPVYPGPQGPIYPYTLNSELGETKEPRTYRAVYLESEYVQV